MGSRVFEGAKGKLVVRCRVALLVLERKADEGGQMEVLDNA